MGMVLACAYARGEGFFDAGAEAEIVAHLREAGLPTTFAELGGGSVDWRAVLDRGLVRAILLKDKKARAGGVTLILPHGIGDCRVHAGVDPGRVADFFVSRLR